MVHFPPRWQVRFFIGANGSGTKEKLKTNNRNKLMTLNIRPVGDRILVEAVEERPQKTAKGGIVIPDTAKEKPMESVVVAVGAGKLGEDGKKLFLEIKKGDRVLVSRHGGTEIQLEGKDYRIFNNEDVLAVIE
jgi:chaperonin GroES